MVSIHNCVVRRSLFAFALAIAAGFIPLADAMAQAPAQNTQAAGPKWSCPTAVADAPQKPQEPATTGSVAPSGDPFRLRIVVVEWKIKKGRECDFLAYWSTRSTIPNRSGLVAEFLSDVDKQPWVNWSLNQDWTTFYNVGIWRATADFQDQIGKHIDNSRPPLEFEAARRTRVFLAPEAWRVGMSPLPASDPAGVR